MEEKAFKPPFDTKYPKQPPIIPEGYNSFLLGNLTILKPKTGKGDNNLIIADRFKIEGYTGTFSSGAIYTCPAEKRAFISYLLFSFRQMGAAGENIVTLTINTKNGSLDIGQVLSYAQNSITNFVLTPTLPFVLEAGESLSVTTDDINGYVTGFGYYLPY